MCYNTSMLNQKQLSGIRGEDLASDLLIQKGYKILQRNFRLRIGEIDIIALDGDTLAFIEVKTRKSSQFGSPLEAITRSKLQSIIRTAQVYKLSHPQLPETMRIDAVAITIADDNTISSIELVKNLT
jgi:putative endonuclease